MGVSQRTLAATLWFFCLVSAVSGGIDKRNGGYTNILVSIAQDVAPDENIIRNLKVVLESASRFLHRATNGRVYFKSFVIEVPKFWPKRRGAQVLGATQFLKSDVRIVSSKSCDLQSPCTVTSSGCGGKGDYIFIPSQYLRRLPPFTAETNESAAYTFVHEWAHLRYGVFDEYGTRGDDSFPETYCVDDKVELSSCSENMPFTANLKNGSFCPTDEECHFGEDCIVTPHNGPKTLTESSIMFMPYVKNISYFCESTSRNRRLHNSAATTKQNIMCSGSSVLDVILRSDDFEWLAEPKPHKRIRVTFKEWQERTDRPQKIVLVLDVSGSMQGSNRINFLKEAATHYIRAIPDGLRRLAIVLFAARARVAFPMTVVNSSTRRHFLKQVDDLSPDDTTCIGCGLELALKVLTAPSDPPHGSSILLITDGRENTAPYVASVMPNIVKSLIEVNSFAIGREADEKLEVLAAATKGQSFCFRDNQPFNGVNIGAAFVTASASEVEPQWPVTVLQVEKDFTREMKQNFIIHESFAKNTIISIRFDPSDRKQPKVELTDPSGQKCAVCKAVSYGDTVRIALPQPVKTGTWTLQLKSDLNEDMKSSVRVLSQISDNTEPIRSRARMINVFVRYPSRSAVIVDVTKGEKIVLNASVIAKITDWRGGTTTLRLRDNGQDPDVYADDGKYSEYFVDFIGSGRYYLRAYVIGHNVNASCRTACSASSNKPLMMKQNTPGPCKLPHKYPKECCELSSKYPKKCFPSYNGTFKHKPQRLGEEKINGTWEIVVDGGTLDVTHKLNKSVYPPLKPWNFRVCCATSGKNGSLLLQMSWNWAGAHLNSGKASSIDIRVSKTSASLKKNFESQEEIDSTHLVKGTLEPGEAHTLNKVTISLSRDWAEVTEEYTRWRVKFAARTMNSRNVTSELSDVADLDYFDRKKYTSENDIEDSDEKAPTKEPPRYTEADKGNEESTGGNNAEDSNDGTSTSVLPLVLALIVAVVVILAAAIWALRMIMDKREDVVQKEASFELTAATSVPLQ
ncbi:calcium-activated chloride channel regulator 4-like [Dermacentor albipictus]|uniref:calcium-activated chloride channel regulator 4-like n=1 Tax=Dermacentor albipictus TaxID=60249 RepID=UPI0031FE354D